jgi:hypothetical protein
MKKLFWILLSLLSFTLISKAQDLVTVTGTIIDSDSIAWSNGVWKASLVNPRGGTVIFIDTGLPVPTSQLAFSGLLSSSGVFSQAGIPNNNALAPAGTQWVFQFCPNASYQCSTLANLTISTNIDLSSIAHTQITAPRFPASGANMYGYSDVEISTVPVPGGFYWNVTNGCMRFWNGSIWQCVTSSSQNPTLPFAYVTQNGAQCNYNINTQTGHDDTAAFLTTINQVESQASSGGAQSAAAIILPATGSDCLINSELRWKANISWYCPDSSSCSVRMGPGLGAQNLNTILPSGDGGPYGTWNSINVSGYGQETTGVAFEQINNIGYHIFNTVIKDHGGIGINNFNSERTSYENITNYSVRKPFNMWGAPNEIHIGTFKALYSGYTEPIPPVSTPTVVQPFYWNLNANSSGVLACPYQGGFLSPINCPTSGANLTALTPNNAWAAVEFDGGTDLYFDGPGSIKGGYISAIKNHANVFVSNLYLERTFGNPSILNPGALVYATLTAPFLAGQYVASVNNIDWMPRRLTSCSDLSETAGTETIQPPDYIPNSNVASDISTGSYPILKGYKEVVQTWGYCVLPNISLVTGNSSGNTGRGLAGGCSNPTGSACPGTPTQINWPVGAVTSENNQSGFMRIVHSNILGVEPPDPGYAYAPDNSTNKALAEIINGAIPDKLNIQPALNIQPSYLIVCCSVMFNDGTISFNEMPAQGQILAETQSVVNFLGTSAAQIPQYSFDTLNATVYDNNSFDAGPSSIRAAAYSNGITACSVVLIADLKKTSTGCNSNSSDVTEVGPTNPSNQNIALGLEYINEYNLFGHPPIPTTPIPTVNPTGGNLGPGNYEVRVNYVESAPVLGIPGYAPTNITVVNGGTGYNAGHGPQTIVGGPSASNCSIVSFSTTTPSTVVLNYSSSCPHTIGNLVSVYGLTSSFGSFYVNGLTFKITSTGSNTETGIVQQPFTIASSSGTVTDMGTSTVSYCPLWKGLPTVNLSTGAITGVSSTLFNPPIIGFCTDLPGATVPLEFFAVDGDTSTGSGANVNLTVLGAYSFPSAPYVFSITSGTTNSVTIPSLSAETHGIAASQNVYFGPPGWSYFVANNGIGTGFLVTSSLTDPIFPNQSFTPSDCQYHCAQSSRVQAYDTGTTNGLTISSHYENGYPFVWTDVYNFDTNNGATFGNNLYMLQGTNPLYRCLTAGNLRAGQTTTVSSDCGTYVDTGLRVP